MRLLQEACIAHTEELGMGRKKTLDKGFLWVITSLHLKINRLPVYDEDVRVECYPGPTLHYFFPRHFAILSSSGEKLLQAHAVWALINEKDRTMIDPGKNGIHIDGFEEGNEIPPVLAFKVPEGGETFPLDAAYSLCDINGHLNNASYLDWALDHVDLSEMEKASIQEVCLTFKKEIRLGESVPVTIKKEGKDLYASCPRFALRIRLS